MGMAAHVLIDARDLSKHSRSSEVIRIFFYLPKRFTEAKLESTRHQVDCYSRNTIYGEIVPI